jgi:acyl-coenzyme A thioesterase 13
MTSDEIKRRVEERVTNAMNTGFQRLFGWTTTSWGDGRCVVELPVGGHLVNLNGTLHGGALATLVDYAGTIAIMTADREGRPGVTTDLNTTYLLATPLGDTAVAEAVVLKSGKTMAYVTVDVRRKSDNQLVAQGRMTKFQAG